MDPWSRFMYLGCVIPSISSSWGSYYCHHFDKIIISFILIWQNYTFLSSCIGVLSLSLCINGFSFPLFKLVLLLIGSINPCILSLVVDFIFLSLTKSLALSLLSGSILFHLTESSGLIFPYFLLSSMLLLCT